MMDLEFIPYGKIITFFTDICITVNWKKTVKLTPFGRGIWAIPFEHPFILSLIFLNTCTR